MKTGIELITKERQEQIEKHRRTIEEDVKYNSNKELSIVAQELLEQQPSVQNTPHNWRNPILHKMLSKPYMDRLIIAGALICAEIDRLKALEGKIKEKAMLIRIIGKRM